LMPVAESNENPPYLTANRWTNDEFGSS